MQYQGEKKKPIPQIGRELNVDAAMEGAVLRSGNRVRIAAQLLYAPTDQHLMAETYEGDLAVVLLPAQFWNCQSPGRGMSEF
jgi:TolB-like protein